MNTVKRFGFGWRTLGLVAAGMLVATVPLQQSVAGESGAKVSPVKSTVRSSGQASVRAGSIPKQQLNYAKPVVIDYRKSSALFAPPGGGVDTIMSVTASGAARGGGIVAATGTSCTANADCNDCDPCTFDVCGTSTCVGGDRNGLACSGNDTFCKGVCDGGINVNEICESDLECCGDGGAIADGACVLNPCVDLGKGNVCINGLIPVGQFEEGSECDDGDDCNGQETCAASACVPDPAGSPCAAGEVCDNSLPGNICVGPCLTDAECDRDASACTNDVCNAKICVGGVDAGKACAVNTDCNSGIDGTCTGGGDGLCTVGTPPCGVGAGCTAGRICDGGTNVGNACTDDANCPGQGGVCGLGFDTGNGTVTCATGRCCSGPGPGDNACLEQNFQACAGTFFGTNNACGLINPTDLADTRQNDCPRYGAGIAPPDTTLGVEVGDIGVGIQCGSVFSSVGSEYQIDAGTGFTDISVLRFVANVDVASRIVLAFHDANGVRIVDQFFFAGANVAPTPGPTVFTGVFDPVLRIPNSGFVVFGRQPNFSPNANYRVLTTDAVDVGTTGSGRMILNDVIVTGDLVGTCVGGTRDGEFCNSQNADADCIGGGTCDTATPDILAFEIVGEAGADPTTACCINAGVGAGSCSTQLPWVCSAAGNIPQGEGTFCSACSNDRTIGCTGVVDCPPLACVGGADDGVVCDVDADCANTACVGGVFAGEFCVDDADCDNVVGACQPGTCTGTPVCLAVPPACVAQACCVDAGLTGGDCVQVSGICNNSPNPNVTLPCAFDGDCPGAVVGSCVGNDCPVGATTSGFGTDCQPNLCLQPVLSGSDNCRIETIAKGLEMVAAAGQFLVPSGITAVPPRGSPPVVETITGSNVTATFDGFSLAECVGGTTEGASCDINLDPDPCAVSGGTCTRLALGGRFDPNNGQDPDWVNCVMYDKPTDFRWDWCGTDVDGNGLEWLPVIGAYYIGCPMAVIQGGDGVEPPIGTGDGGVGGARGTPFCARDNFWGTDKVEPYVLICHATNNAPNGTGASPPGAPYQFHFTAVQSPDAACCSDVCSGGTRDGRPCSVTDIPCPGPGVRCVDAGGATGVCNGGMLFNHSCDLLTGFVDQCGTGGTCGGPGCELTSELECTDFGGAWLAGDGFANRQCDAVGCINDGKKCETDEDCCNTAGACKTVGPVITCGLTALDNPCAEGSCCKGPGDCEDRDPNTNARLKAADCVGAGETFVGGARCLFDPSPCPICTVPVAGNCFPDSAGFIFGMTENDNGGQKLADDVVMLQATVNQFCFSPCFVNVEGGAVVNECNDPDSANNPPPPPDNFTVSFFTDVNGAPGALVHEVANAPIAAKAAQDINVSRCWDYSIVFDPPLGDPARPPAFVPGDKYWVAFSGVGTPGGSGVGCDVFLLGSEQGNNFFLQELDHFDSANQTWTFEDHSGTNLDLAFCVGSAFEPSIQVPPPVTGACCTCDGVCDSNVEWRDCRGYQCLSDGTGDLRDFDCTPDCGPNATIPCNVPALPQYANAKFFPGQLCTDITCANEGGGGGCAGGAAVLREDCAAPEPIGVGIPQNEVFNVFINNSCSTTDGRSTYVNPPGCTDDDGTQEGVVFGRDQWFSYVSACTGRVQIDVTGDTDMDVAIAVYTDGTNTVPLCDDTTVTGSPTGAPNLTTLVPQSCTSDPDNAGLNRPSIEIFSDIDVAYLIRVGADQDNQLGPSGSLTMQVQCFGETCQPSPVPAGTPIQTTGGATTALITGRHLAVSGGAPGENQVLSVKLVNMAGTFSKYNGTRMFAKPNTVHLVSELPGRGISAYCLPDPAGTATCGNPVCGGGTLQGTPCDLTVDPDPCIGTDPFNVGSCRATSYLVVELGCGADPADFIDWTVNPFDPADANPVFHIKSEFIVPDSTYEVGFAHSSCDALSDLSYGDQGTVLTLSTSLWMDSNELQGGQPLQPGGVVSGFDIAAMVDGFGGQLARMPLNRLDAVGVTTAGNVPFVDGVLGVVELSSVLDAFASVTPTYPLALSPHCSDLDNNNQPTGVFTCRFGPSPGISCTGDVDCFTPICP